MLSNYISISQKSCIHSHPSRLVGIAQAIQGLCLVLTAVPGGCATCVGRWNVVRKSVVRCF